MSSEKLEKILQVSTISRMGHSVFEYFIKKTHEYTRAFTELISTHCVADQNKVSKHVSNVNC